MRARELAEFLLRFPDHLVQMEGPNEIVPVTWVERDHFGPEEGPSIVLSTAEWGDDA